jgi:hypothetical protein
MHRIEESMQILFLCYHDYAVYSVLLGDAFSLCSQRLTLAR